MTITKTAGSKLQVHPKLLSWHKKMEQNKNIQDVLVNPSFKIDCTSTGSTALNLLIGGSRLPDGSFVCAGWPKGSIIEIYGRESSGKSTIALMGMAQSIKAGGCGLYVDLEHAVKDYYALKLGVDFRPPQLGGPGNAMRIAPPTAEEVEYYVNAAAGTGVDFIVIDSVAGLVSAREAERDVTSSKEKQGVAEIPRFMANWMPKLQTIIAQSKTTVIFLNQTRDKIGAMGFSEEALKSTTGGNSLKFWAAVRMMLQPKESTKAKIFNPLTKENEEVPIATDIKVKNIKNKIDARQGHTGMITIRYGTGVDEVRTILNVAQAYKIIDVSKNKLKQEVFTFISPGSGKEIKATGMEKFRDVLKKDQISWEEIKNLSIDKILEGNKPIDDDSLSQLSEDSFTRMKIEEEDDEEYVATPAPDVKYVEHSDILEDSLDV
jgi:recombination protein RecA